ncbi:hypothetical protein HPB49_015308 [Dermacentor silvarum]|uniref:Uncharacterized protein n=1 Tax=Dermacentor silvarum TaxID=543639 RepID=A0ACB8E172_DERSI|nr:hypothetical protein HPB49_015308 [Dermacentor silvarum]
MRGAAKFVCDVAATQEVLGGGGAARLSRPESARKGCAQRARRRDTCCERDEGRGAFEARRCDRRWYRRLRFRSGVQINVQARDDGAASDYAACSAAAAGVIGFGAGRPMAGGWNPAARTLHRDGSDRGLSLLGPGDRVPLLR